MQVDYSALHLKSCGYQFLQFDLSNFWIRFYGGLSAAMGQGIAKAGNVFQFYHQF